LKFRSEKAPIKNIPELQSSSQNPGKNIDTSLKKIPHQIKESFHQISKQMKKEKPQSHFPIQPIFHVPTPK
jgi:hypothetical protein